MALKRFATEFGMGVDLRGEDHTKAAIRAVKDALHRNSITVAPALGKDPGEMVVKCSIGVAEPNKVETAEVAKVYPPFNAAYPIQAGSASNRCHPSGIAEEFCLQRC